MEKLSGSKLKLNEYSYSISDNLQNVFTNTSKTPLKKFNEKYRELFEIVFDWKVYDKRLYSSKIKYLTTLFVLLDPFYLQI